MLAALSPNSQATSDVVQNILNHGGHSSEGGALSTGDQTNRVAEMLRRTALVTISFKRLGLVKTVDSDKVDSDADKSRLRVTKKLLQLPEVAAIALLDKEIGRYVADLCTDTGIKQSLRFVPLTRVERLERRLREFRAEREALVDSASQLLDPNAENNLIDRDREGLQDLFDTADYPTPEVFRSMYSFTWNYVTMGVPNALQQISAELFAQEREKHEQMFQEAHALTQQILRERTLKLVQALTDRLRPDEEGKPKRFNKKSMENLSAYLAEFDEINIADDGALQGYVEQMKSLLSDVNPDGVRTDLDLRAKLSEQFDQIEKSLSGMIETAPARAISFDDV